MNINGISSNEQVSQLNAITPSTTTASDVDSTSPGVGDAAVAHLSGPGRLMSKLAALKANDPAKFQSIVSDMASKLKDAASQASGPGAQFLTNLSTKLSDIANGGDISQLGGPAPAGAAPAGGAGGPQSGGQVHHGHHHHGGGGGGGGMSSGDDSSTTDASGQTIRSTLESVFGQLDSALNSTASTNSVATATSST